MAKKQDRILGGFILAIFLVMIIIVLILFVGLGTSTDIDFTAGGDKVAIVELEGIILSSQSTVKEFKRYNKESSIKAIVFRIDSPGGGIAASQEIYEHVKRVRDSGKPVVVSMGSVAASGGYYVALGSNKIMANPGTTTGSIGVIAEFTNIQKLLDKIGIEMTVIKSGTFKDTGSPYRELSEKDKEYLQEWIDNGYEQFISAVSIERSMDIDSVKKYADGRVYSGEKACQLALIDTLGTFEDAINLAAKLGGIKGEPKIVRAQKRKLTAFELLFSYDFKELFNRYFSTWPRIQYLMSI